MVGPLFEEPGGLDRDHLAERLRKLAGENIYIVDDGTMGQIVQKETLPLHVLVENQLAGYPDLVDLSRAPIGPGQTKTVRITLEHISDSWDQSYPQMELVDLKLK